MNSHESNAWMSRVDWQRLNTAFARGADLPSPARTDYLLALADQDAALAEEVPVGCGVDSG